LGKRVLSGPHRNTLCPLLQSQALLVQDANGVPQLLPLLVRLGLLGVELLRLLFLEFPVVIKQHRTGIVSATIRTQARHKGAYLILSFISFCLFANSTVTWWWRARRASWYSLSRFSSVSDAFLLLRSSLRRRWKTSE